MKKLRTIILALIIISVIPIIEVEKLNEYNGSTVIEYRNLISYGWEYTVEWYLNYKENNLHEEETSENGDETPSPQNRQDR